MTDTDYEYADVPDALPSYVEDTIANHADDAEVLAAIREFADMLHGAAEKAEISKEEIKAKNSDGKIQSHIPSDESGTFVSKKVKCGDNTCKCASGREGDMHGPYLYRVERNGDSLSWEYEGKVVPGDEPDPSSD